MNTPEKKIIIAALQNKLYTYGQVDVFGIEYTAAQKRLQVLTQDKSVSIWD